MSDVDVVSAGTAANPANLVVSAGTAANPATDVYSGLTAATLDKLLVRREYICTVAITVNSVPLYWSTQPEYRDSQWYEDKLSEWMVPSDDVGDEYQILTRDSFDISVEDDDLSLATYDAYWLGTTATVSLITRRYYHDSSSDEAIFRRNMLVTSWSRSGIQLSLSTRDFDDKMMEKEYPPYKYEKNTYFPDILTTDIGVVIPDVVGYGLKLTAIPIDDDAGAGPFVYGVCMKPTGHTVTIPAVYRGEGAIVDPADYTVGALDCGDYDIVTITFATHQLDFSFQPYLIQCDVYNSSRSQNAATELSRIMTWAGLTMNARSLLDAETVATANSMTVSYGYGYSKSPVSVKSIVENLLFVLRGQLFRNDDGEYEILQDVVSSVAATYYENEGDLISVDSYSRESYPDTIKVSYRPNVGNPAELQHTLTRTLAGGLDGERAYELPMVRDFTPADQFHCYRTLRWQHNYRAEVTVHNVQHYVGELIAVGGTVLWSGLKTWIITGIQRDADNNQLSLLEYDEAVYVYTPGTEPQDGSGYFPDYANTLPLAPTEFTITASGVETAATGAQTAWYSLQCRPPGSNWSKIYFGVNDGTALMEGRPSGEYYIATLSGLIAGRSDYIFLAWAENSNALSGIAGVEDVNYARITIYTPVADTDAPGTPTAPVASQGTGKSIDVTWTALSKVTYPDLAGYILKRSTSLGGVYTEIWRGDATRKTDAADLSYATTYYYKVAAYDTSGNTSSDSAASNSVYINYIDGGGGGIGGGEIRNIDASNITVGSISCDRLNGGSITGQVIRTSSSATRLELSNTTNELHVYVSGTTPPLSTYGFTTAGLDSCILKIGDTGLGYAGYGARIINQSSNLSTVYISNDSTWGPALTIQNGQIQIPNENTTIYLGDGVEIAYSDVSLYRYTDDWIASSKNLASVLDMYAAGRLGFRQNSGSPGLSIVYRSSNEYLTTSGTSDKRLKKDICPISSALEHLQRIEAVTFLWNELALAGEESNPLSNGMDRNINHDKQYGFIAQSFLQDFPDMISTDDNGYYGLNPLNVLPVVVAAVQELSNEVETLKKKLS